jgi:hypothetical protein
MRIFIAGSFARREELRGRKAELEKDHRIEVVSSWLEGEVPSTYIHASRRKKGQSPESEAFDAKAIEDNLADMCDCHVFVLQAEEEGVTVTGGKHVEFGYAMALSESGRAEGKTCTTMASRWILISTSSKTGRTLPSISRGCFNP